MTMFAALDRALEIGAYARPVGDSSYTYQWVACGRDHVLRIGGRTSPSAKHPGRYVEDELAVLPRSLVLDEWMVCRQDGDEVGPRAAGPSLSDLV